MPDRLLLAKAKREADLFSWSIPARSRLPDEMQHVVFVKVHKAASTTVQNVFLRFALSRQLNVLFPRISNNLQFRDGSFDLLPHPPSPPFLFNILCNHVLFQRKQIRDKFPSGTHYVAIVRRPWEQVKSAFNYYTTIFHPKYLRKVPSFQALLENRKRYEPKNAYLSQTNNRMSLDLGLPFQQLSNHSYVQTFLHDLDNDFHLVLLAERFDESMVLLRRMLKWTVKDIVYLKLNAMKTQPAKTPTPDPQLFDRFTRFQHFDEAVYEHFAGLFQRKVEQQGEDFDQEVKEFIHVELQLSEFCRQANSTSQKLTILASRWHESFSLQRSECTIMTAPEIYLNQWMKGQQLARLAPAIYSAYDLSNRSGVVMK